MKHDRHEGTKGATFQDMLGSFQFWWQNTAPNSPTVFKHLDSSVDLITWRLALQNLAWKCFLIPARASEVRGNRLSNGAFKRTVFLCPVNPLKLVLLKFVWCGCHAFGQ